MAKRDIDELDAATDISDTDKLPVAQSGPTLKRAVFAQIKAWTVSLPIAATGGPTTRPLADRFGEVANLKDYGASGDGTTDDRSALNSAITSATTKGSPIYIPPGTYRIASAITVSVPLEFAQGAKLKPDSGINVDLTGGYNAGDYDHVFDISAGGTVTGTKATRGYVTPQHFGALASGVANDDTSAINAAIRFGTLAVIRDEYASSLRVVFPLSPAGTITATTGFYHVTSDIVVNRNVVIEGAGPPNRSLGSVMIRFASTCEAGFFLAHPGGLSAPEPYATEMGGLYGAGRPVMRNLCLEPVSATAKTHPSTSIDAGTDTITFTAHGYPTGRAVSYTSTGTGSGPGGLTTGRIYYVINTGADTFKLATTPAKALAGTAVDITSAGDATKVNRTTAVGMVDYGIVHNLPVVFENVEVKGFRKAGFFAHGQSSGNSAYGDPNGSAGSGTMFGNTNGSHYQKCLARDTVRGHGFAAQGNNTQIMTYITCDASGNAGSGFLDNSSIGNIYYNNHSSQNSFKALHNAVYYMCIKKHTADASNEPGVGVDWRDYWTAVTATTADADWTAGDEYIACGGINVVDAGASTAIFGHYTEGGIELGVIPRGSTSIFGGEAVILGRVLRHGEFGNCQVYGGVLANTPAAWKHTDTAGFLYGSGLSAGSFTTVPDLYAFGHSEDDAAAPNIWKLTWSAVRKAYEWNRSASRKLSFTGTGYSQAGYSGAGLIVANEGIIVGGPSSSNHGRVRFVANNASISGTVVRGEIFFYSQPTAGGRVGAIVTTAGTVGSTAVVKEFGTIDA